MTKTYPDTDTYKLVAKVKSLGATIFETKTSFIVTKNGKTAKFLISFSYPDMRRFVDSTKVLNFAAS